MATQTFSGLKRRFPLVLAVVFASSLCASTYSFQTINDPADAALQTPTFNQLLGINDAGVIAGYYGDGVIVNNHGFTYSGGTFTNENVSGADQTQVVAINNTLHSGTYDTAGFWVNNASGANHGFTDIGGVMNPNINGPGSTMTQVLGLNDNHQAVGFFTTGGVTQGFTYNTSTMTVTPLTVPASWLATSVTAAGVNNSGTIAGFYSTAGGTFGFIDKGGVFSSPTDPLGTNPMFFGLNNVGQIVGTDTTAGGYSEGFVYNMITNTWTPVLVPGSATNTAFGMMGTILNGINDSGDLVGFYADAGSGNLNGVLATPTPEPGYFALTGLALALVVFGRRRFFRQN